MKPTTITSTAIAVLGLAGASACDGVDGTGALVGQLDELMIYGVALTQSQIQTLGN